MTICEEIPRSAGVAHWLATRSIDAGHPPRDADMHCMAVWVSTCHHVLMQRGFWPDTSYQKMPYVAKCCHNLPKNCQMSPQYAKNGQTIFPHAQKKSQDICRWDKIYPLERPSVMVCFLLFLVIWFWLNYRSNQGRAELGVPCIFPFKYKVKHILRSKE